MPSPELYSFFVYIFFVFLDVVGERLNFRTLVRGFGLFLRVLVLILVLVMLLYLKKIKYNKKYILGKNGGLDENEW